MNASRLFVVGISGPALLPEERRLLRECPPGGVILFARNLREPGQIEDLIAEVRASAPETMIYADQEGGAVDRFRAVTGPSISLRRAAGIGRAREAGETAGEICRRFGIDVDLAPVVDLASAGAGAEVLAERTASGDPEAATAAAREFLEGLRERGVAGCLKHFPGLGRGTVDSHRDLPRIGEAPDETARDLAPFAALSDQAPLVMVSHAAVGESDRPASLDRRIAGEWLRRRVGFSGAAISDDLEMGALEGFGDLPARAVAAVEAGCDLLCFGSRTEAIASGAEAVAAAVGRGRLAAALARAEALREAVGRLRRSSRGPLRTLPELIERTARLLEAGEAAG